MKIIGLTGPARSGKDTVAEILMKELDCSAESFATPIKRMLAFGLNISTKQLYGNEKDRETTRYGKTTREMLQTLGTEWGRNMIHPDIWVKALEGFIDYTNDYLIIPDVRFENEAEWVRKQGILIHITGRGGIDGNHESENGVRMTAHDLVIDNSGTLEELSQEVSYCLDHIYVEDDS